MFGLPEAMVKNLPFASLRETSTQMVQEGELIILMQFATMHFAFVR